MQFWGTINQFVAQVGASAESTLFLPKLDNLGGLVGPQTCSCLFLYLHLFTTATFIMLQLLWLCLSVCLCMCVCLSQVVVVSVYTIRRQNRPSNST